MSYAVALVGPSRLQAQGTEPRFGQAGAGAEAVGGDSVAGEDGSAGEQLPLASDVCAPLAPRVSFEVFEDAATWHGARDSCLARGGRLALPRDEGETLRVALALAGREVEAAWIGASDDGEEGVWLDAGGAAPSYLRWAVYEPTSANELEDCAAIRQHGRWSDEACAQELPYVCVFGFLRCGDGECAGPNESPETCPQDCGG